MNAQNVFLGTDNISNGTADFQVSQLGKHFYQMYISHKFSDSILCWSLTNSCQALGTGKAGKQVELLERGQIIETILESILGRKEKF